MVKMIYYLPDMHEFFKYFPTQNLMKEQNAVLTKPIDTPIHFISEEQEEHKEETK